MDKKTENNPHEHSAKLFFVSLFLTILSVSAIAAPQGGEVVSGTGSIEATNAQTTLVTQESQNLSINWQSLNLAADELLQFDQPNSEAAALNYILDQHPSEILGRIDANGRVFLMNPNGIIFGESARINVGSLVAGSFQLDRESINERGEFIFNTGTGLVENAGQIVAEDGGSIALVGQTVRNNGQITARLGKVHLLSADTATLSFDRDGLIQFNVQRKSLNNTLNADSAISNTGSIQADGGYVVLEARAANNIYQNVINNDGLIQANRISNEGGVIRLEGYGGNVMHSGSINTVGVNGNTGGNVAIMGDRVGVSGNASITASGDTGGGNIAIGGQRKGEGEQTAEFTQLAKNTVIRADAINSGDGGEIVAWADDTTWASGTISARGGEIAGDGGFVEISGKQGLVLTADVNLTANNGKLGTLLLDPTDITIHDQADGAQGNDGLLPDLSDGTQGAGTFDIGELALEGLAASSILVLEATNNIVVNDLADNVLALGIDGSGSVTMTADSDNDGSGSFSMNAGDTISTQGSSLSISGAGVTLGSLNTDGPVSDGVITVNSSASTSIASSTSGTQTMTVAVDTNANSSESLTVTGTLSGGTINLQGGTDGGETLIGPNLPNTWTVTSLNTGTLNGANFSNFPNLTGGTSNDSFTVTGIGSISGLLDGGADTTGDVVDYSGASGIISITLGTDVTNVESLIGNGADYSLTAENVVNNWVLSGQNDGSVAGVSFTDFSNLNGGSDTDTFTLSGGSTTGTISGGAGTDSLSANNTTNNWSILAADSGNVDSVFAFTGIENLTGGTGSDNFILNSGSVTGVIDGGSGNDSLAPDNVANTWNITANDAGTVTGVGSFISIENLNGRNDTDDFTIDDGFSISGTIDAGGGTDTIDLSLQTGAVLVDLSSGSYANIEQYTGNGANSSFVGDNVVNVWNINGIADGVNDGTVGTVSFIDFASITGGTDADSFTLSSGTLTGALNGGAGSDTLIGDNTPNTFDILGADSGNATGVGSFANIENLTGNANTDDFFFGAVGSLSGVVNGSTNTDSVDYSAVAGAVTVTIGAAGFLNIESFVGNNTDSTLIGANTLNDWDITGINDGTLNLTTSFTDFNNITGGTNNDTFNISGGSISGVIDGGLGTDTLVGDISNNTWNITGANSGNVAGAPSFSDIENLTGNTGDDDFVFAVGGSLSGVINGAAGADGVDYSAKPGAVSVDLSSVNFVSIETFTGNNSDSTLIATNTPNSWNITGINDGTVGTISFVDFNHLLGNNNTDNFLMSVAGSVTGSIDGGAGSDILQGYTTGASWNIIGADVGNLSGVADFSNVETLLGGNGIDTFTFSNGSSFSGTINGGAGNDVIDFSAELGAVSIDLGLSSIFNMESFIGNNSNSTLIANNTVNTWTLTAANSGTLNSINFSGFTDLVGNVQGDQFFLTGGSVSGSIDGAGSNDYLTADNVVNTWAITGSDQGSVTGVASFLQIENLTGNNQLDAFVFGNGATMSGIVDGGAGNDSADFAAEAGSVNIALGVSAYNNIETFIGNNIDSTLVGPVTSNTWTITGNNDGTVGAINFTNFNNLTGNVSSDNFQFQDGSMITGVIDGAAGLDSVDFSAESGVVNVALGSAGFLFIETFTGNNLTSTLTGDNLANTWVLTGANTGSVGSVNFAGFNNLVGNANTDDFSLNGGSISGSIDGGAGTDSITADNTSNTWTITSADAGAVTGITTFSDIENLIGSSGADSFMFADGSSISGSINGGAGSGINSVNQSAQTGLVSITLGGSGYSNIDTFTGNGINSTLIGENIINTWNINGLDSGTLGPVNFSNISNLQGGTSDDSFSINGGSLSGQINGSSGNDLIQANNITNTWNITGADVGNVNGVSSFIGIETLAGNASSDTFIFADGASYSGLIDGAGGTDNVDFSSQTGAVVTSLASGQYQNIESFTGNNFNSTLVGNNVVSDWIITGGNSGSINTINFSGFNNLTGNASADTFTVSGGSISGTIDGGSGNDTIQGDNINTTWNVLSPDAGNLTSVNAFQNIDNLVGGNTADIINIVSDVSGNVDGGGGDDAINIGGLVTIGGTVIGNTGSDTLTGPTQNSNWIISATDNGSVNGIAFDQIEVLTGNTGDDIFNVTNSATANISGGISGGAGNDELLVDYLDASTRTIAFDGSAGTDLITLTGSATGATNSYVFGPATGQVDITTTTVSNIQQINGTNVENIADTFTADNMSLVGSSGDDSIVLSPGMIAGAQPVSFQIASMPTLQFSNKTNLSLDSGLGDDTLQINGTVAVAGDMTLSAESIIEGTAGVLAADTLTFNQATIVGTAGATLATSVNTLLINGPTVDAYIDEANGVAIAASNITGVLDVTTSSGDITSAGAVTVSGSSLFSVGNGGSIILDNSGNQFNGTPLFSSTGTINNLSLTDNSAVDLQGLTLNGNLVVVADGPVTQAGALNVQGASSISAGANPITLNNSANDFVGDLALQNSGAATNTTIVDANSLVLAASNVGSGTLTVTAADISQSGAMMQSANAGAATFTATGGNIALTNGANDFTGTVYLNNSGAGNTALTESSDLVLGSSDTNGGDLTVTADNGITLLGTTTSSGGDIVMTANTGNIQLGRVNSGSGLLRIDATAGDVIGNNSPITDPNLSSQTLEIVAGGTIGDFNNPISVNVPSGGTSFFSAGTGSANIIGLPGTILGGSVIVNDVAATNSAVGKGQSVSFLEQDLNPPQVILTNPLYSVSSGGLHLIEYPRDGILVPEKDEEDEKNTDNELN